MSEPKEYTCIYCREGKVQSFPADCPHCGRHLSLLITGKTKVFELAQAVHANGCRVEFKIRPGEEHR